MNAILLALSALAFALVFWAGGRMIAQEENVLDCLPDTEGQIFTYGQDVSEVTAWEWESYQDVTGEPIKTTYELGYEEWDVPLDVEHVLTIRNQAQREDEWIVWVWWSPSTPGFSYWWVYDHTIPDAEGVLHACGAYRVDREIWR